MQTERAHLVSDDVEPPQFSIRGILIVTTLCAVAFAILAPLVRAQTAKERTALAIGYLVLFCLIGFSAFVLRLKNATILKQAGERLYLTGKAEATWGRRVLILFGVALVFFVWPFLASKGVNFWPLIVQNVFFCVLFLAAAFDSRRLEFRRNGIVHMRIHFIPWAKIDSYRWTGKQSEKLLLQHTDRNIGFLNVPAADRAAVERILQEQLTASQCAAV